MNPQATWTQLLAAYEAGEWDAIEDHAKTLLAWLDHDGPPPNVLSRNLGPHWNRALARAGCLIALEIVHGEWRLAPQQASA